jgi:drug/metabolite transporter (DMT)-like permease
MDKSALQTTSRSHAEGMVIMSIGMLILPVMDGVGKYLATEEGMSPGQVTFYRFFVQLIFTVAIIIVVSGPAALRPKRFWMNIVRGIIFGGASLCFFTAVKYMPIADALAIFFVEPFILTAMSALFLGEQVGWRRWSAIAVGFSGALIVIQPSFVDFGWVALLPLGTAFLFATYLLMNRTLGVHDTPMVMQCIAGIGGAGLMACFLGIGVAGGIENLEPSWPASPLALVLVLALGALATFGHAFVIRAFQTAPPSLLAPFQYLEIVSAVIMGYLVFGDVLDASKWLGVAIIVSSGLFIFRRERRLRDAQATAEDR